MPSSTAGLHGENPNGDPARAGRDTARAPRRWPLRLAALALLAVCATLTGLLMHSPLGALPFAPETWKGVPMTLGAAFCGLLGGFILLQRRFSLAALLAAIFSAALFATGTQAYVRNLHEVDTVVLDFLLPEAQTEEFVKLTRENLTEARLRGFLEDARAAGFLREPLPYDEVNLGVGRPEQGKGQQVIVNWVYCPFVHKRVSPGRDLAMRYALLVSEYNSAKLNLHSASDELRYQGVWARVEPLVNQFDAAQTYRGFPPIDKYRWLIDREPDAELQKVLQDALDRELTGIKALQEQQGRNR
ncbi:MAG: hypothetical protein M5U26_00635 [Planctomycetota bacterium]|nr:hypothetical protein [Planctomycetota bacterium]